jgi:hypothetical protein
MLQTRGRNSPTWAPLTSFTPSIPILCILGKVLKEGDQQGAQLFCTGSHGGEAISIQVFSLPPPPPAPRNTGYKSISGGGGGVGQ